MCGGGGHLIVDEYVKQPRGSPQGNTRAKRASGHFAALCLPLESEIEAKKKKKKWEGGHLIIVRELTGRATSTSE